MPAPVSAAGGSSNQLAPITVNVPGSFGLNLQAQNAVLPAQWSIESLNTVIDQFGRVAARNGRTTVTSSAASGQIRSIFEYITPTGTSLPVIAYDGGISSSVTSPSGSSLVGTITSVASGRWYFHNFMGKAVGFQAGQKPIVIQNQAGTFSNIVEASGTAPTGGVGTAAYGRVWGIDGDGYTLKFCALGDETNWAAGDAGSIDLRHVWPKGMDTVMAIGAFAGTLVIFGKRQILFYGSSDATVLGLDVTQLKIVDAIEGVGCISQWTLAEIGGEKENSDLLFCSLTGVQSLQRLVQNAGSHPIQNLTKNVRDALIAMLSTETASAVSGFYCPTNGFYALSLPTSGYTWIVDQRHKFQDPDGDLVARVTRWPFATTAFSEFSGRRVYFASSATGKVQQYLPGSDDNTPFNVTLQLPWLDFGEDNPAFAARLKALKRIGGLVYSLSGANITFTWYTDFAPLGLKATVTAPGGSNAQWNLSEWGNDQWSGGLLLNLLVATAAGTGQYFSVAITTSTDSNFAIQQVNLLAKVLRLA